MRINKMLILIATIIIFSIIIRCDSENKDKIKLIVLCDGTFQGTYIYNGKTPVGFGGDSEENPYHQTGSSYYYEKIFKDLDSLEVDATRDFCTDSIRIKIYRDDIKVMEEVLDADSESTCIDNSVSISYEYGEEDNTTSTTE